MLISKGRGEEKGRRYFKQKFTTSHHWASRLNQISVFASTI